MRAATLPTRRELRRHQTCCGFPAAHVSGAAEDGFVPDRGTGSTVTEVSGSHSICQPAAVAALITQAAAAAGK